jgi:1,4-dihydroxy-2-naphthoate octaprenyltransferase
MSKILRLTHPLHLLLAALTFALGTGITRYLGAAVKWLPFWLGLLAVLALQAAAALLVEYFRLSFLPLAPEETPRLRELFRTRLLQAAYAALTLSGAAIVSLLLFGALDLAAGILLALAVLLLMAYAVPPARLSETGYGELIQAVIFTTFYPAIAFLLQAGEVHRLLPLTAFPLTLLAIAWLLAADFSAFAADQKLGRRSLLIRLTWQRAVPIHHVLILTAFLLFAAASFFGVSWGLVWPVFLALPFAALQIYWLQRIASGGRPVWKFFDVLVPSVYGLTVYLLALSFWLR